MILQRASIELGLNRQITSKFTRPKTWIQKTMTSMNFIIMTTARAMRSSHTHQISFLTSTMSRGLTNRRVKKKCSDITSKSIGNRHLHKHNPEKLKTIIWRTILAKRPLIRKTQHLQEFQAGEKPAKNKKYCIGKEATIAPLWVKVGGRALTSIALTGRLRPIKTRTFVMLNNYSIGLLTIDRTTRSSSQGSFRKVILRA